jgi:hypothetical protein
MNDELAGAEGIGSVVVAGWPSRCRQACAEALPAAVLPDIEALADVLAGSDASVIALYQAPWEAFLEACGTRAFHGGEATDWLRAWLEYHEQLLAEHSVAPDRFLLLNAGRIRFDDGALHSALAAHGAAITAQPELPDTAATGEFAQRAAFLASQMETLGPEYWDAYEALESVALLLGREAEFRGARPGPAKDLSVVLRLCGEGIAAQAELASAAMQMEALRQAAEAQAAAAAAELEATRQSAISVDAAADLRMEHELLTQMLQQLQAEMDYQVGSNRDLRVELEKTTDASERARLAISRLVARND